MESHSFNKMKKKISFERGILSLRNTVGISLATDQFNESSAWLTATENYFVGVRHLRREPLVSAAPDFPPPLKLSQEVSCAKVIYIPHLSVDSSNNNFASISTPQRLNPESESQSNSTN
jgi:hypothetical protein